MKYRKKPVVIDAMQFNGNNQFEIMRWIESLDTQRHITWHFTNGKIEIPTLEGVMSCSKDDWVIRGVSGEFYPCKPDIFELTYEEVK